MRQRYSACRLKKLHSGHSLVEMMIVVAIIAVISSAAFIAANPLRQIAVDAASREIVQALRHAQNEARRSRSVRVVRIDATNRRVRVYQLDYSKTPPVEDTAKPVMHPLDKKLYEVNLEAMSFIPVTLQLSAAFRFGNDNVLPHVGFAADGSPVMATGPAESDVSPLVEGVPAAQIAVRSGNAIRHVRVDPVSGRVILTE